jgi:hypothetical protein
MSVSSSLWDAIILFIGGSTSIPHPRREKKVCANSGGILSRLNKGSKESLTNCTPYTTCRRSNESGKIHTVIKKTQIGK